MTNQQGRSSHARRTEKKQDLADKFINSYREARFGYSLWMSLAMVFIIPYLLFASPSKPDTAGMIAAGVIWFLCLLLGIYRLKVYIGILKHNQAVRQQELEEQQASQRAKPLE